MKQRLGCMTVFILLIMSSGGTPLSASAVKSCDKWIAKAVSIQGSMQVLKTDESEWEPVTINNKFCTGDTIRVMKRSRAVIVLSNENVLRLDQDTTITFSSAEEEQTLLLKMLNGVIHIFSVSPRSLKVITPFVNAGVEGTEFSIAVDKDRAVVTVFEGRVRAVNKAGGLTLSVGQSAAAGEGRAPVSLDNVQPKDTVQWSFYYPPVLDYRKVEFFDRTHPDWQTKARMSAESYYKGDLETAFSSIEDIPGNLHTSRFLNYRGMLLLSVGRVDEARKDISRSLDMGADNSEALCLQSIIASVRNEKGIAVDLASKAAEAAPASAAPLMALSFALQANYDLNGALNSISKAVELEPDNALAWARLAEMWLSFSNLDKALEAAGKAVELNPQLARTQSVLGFAYLARVKTRESLYAFTKAIELDQADPLPRLGLGLVQISQGKLKEGRKEIEIAAGLDPGNSLIRSYLGKAYYEEKRDSKASDQYRIAKKLDPQDPTPFFYSSIQKQGLNRPVDALHDMQEAIRLNDNRAVYRSRLLLDADLAARSASLARIYGNLGFDQLSLVEGWKSLNADPGSYSAHRFLADSYSVLPRHEIARVSELLQAELLQPLNITPVQPYLGESSLSVLSGSGPGELSFNEFNPLFNRNRFSLQAGGVIGDNDTLGNDLVIAGVYNRYSISAGQYHYETEGYRENNDLQKDIYNIFSQVRLSHRTSILAEFRATDTEKGDLTLNFNPDDFRTHLRTTEETRSIRLGLRQSFTPGSGFIATVIYKDTDETLYDTVPMSTGPPLFMTFPADFNITQDNDGYMAEVQYLLNREHVKIVGGAGIFSGDRRSIHTIDSTTIKDEETYLQHTNYYVYSYLDYFSHMTWTIGASADFFMGGLEDQTRGSPNPKIGVTWNPLPATTLRAAAFKVLTRTLISSQTLEPTQVAGFNQFFDDAAGTESWRYGIAADHKFSRDVYGGLEYSVRDLSVPFESLSLSSSTLEVSQADWKEQLGHIYIYWMPHAWLSLTAAYQYERFDRDEEYPAQIEEVKTHRFPLGINVYHPSGLFARLKASHLDQDGMLQPQGAASSTDCRDTFWIVDASIGYRLPGRRGIFTVEAKNLFDESFHYQDTDPVSPTMQPERSVFCKFTLAL